MKLLSPLRYAIRIFSRARAARRLAYSLAAALAWNDDWRADLIGATMNREPVYIEASLSHILSAD